MIAMNSTAIPTLRMPKMAALTFAILFLPAVFATQSVEASNYKIVYSLSDGGLTRAGLVRDSEGNLYGTTEDGGVYSAGSVFKVDKTGTGTVLYSFTGGVDGGYPQANLVLDSQGNLYGTTPYEGSGSCAGGIGCGVVFKVDKTGAETVLHSFSGEDGMYPFAGLVRGPDGSLYGTTQYGGAYGAGTVFKLDASGKETLLYSFTAGSDGAQPLAGLVRDKTGKFYGTTSSSGAPPCNCGTVFMLDLNGKETVLHSFSGADGEYPLAGLVLDAQGNLYGTTFYGGASGFGTVFKLDTNAMESVLYSFTGGSDGGFPRASLVRDGIGNLYGTAQVGGGYGYGTVFEVNAKGNERVLHSFSYSPDGETPYAGLVWCSKYSLCGTTEFGGAYNSGAVFRIVP
jgi:uncharacterized repeat protein (TIGR03803 family)